MCGRYQLTTEENIQEIQEIVAEINLRCPVLHQKYFQWVQQYIDDLNNQNTL